MRRRFLFLAALLAASASASLAAGRVVLVPWTAAKPRPDVRSLAAPCRAGELKPWIFLQGAGGSMLGGVTVANAGRTPCSLLGAFHVRLPGSHHRVVVTSSRRTRDADSPPLGRLRDVLPGEQADFGLDLRNWCGKNIPKLVVTLAGGGSLTLDPPGLPRCDAPTEPTYVSATKFEPTALPAYVTIGDAEGRTRTDSSGENLVTLTVRRGEILRYTVWLSDGSAVAPLRFVRCPAYEEVLRAGRDFIGAQNALETPGPRESYVLNCRSVGWLRPNAKGGIAFAMRLHVPRNAHVGANTLAWHLLGTAWYSTDAVRVVVRP